MADAVVPSRVAGFGYTKMLAPFSARSSAVCAVVPGDESSKLLDGSPDWPGPTMRYSGGSVFGMSCSSWSVAVTE